MKVIRKQEIETTDYSIGDQIEVRLEGEVNGTYTATVHRIDENGILFMFDDCIAEHEMNTNTTNKGGYENSDLKKWLSNNVLPSFPNSIREKIIELSIPSYEMIFGRGYPSFIEIEKTDDEQLELMKNRKNRIAIYKDYTQWYWLKNRIENSPSSFAFVGISGLASSTYASRVYGVRPVFLIKQ